MVLHKNYLAVVASYLIGGHCRVIVVPAYPTQQPFYLTPLDAAKENNKKKFFLLMYELKRAKEISCHQFSVRLK